MRPELLLHPNIPKPLHGMSPRELLGDEWWDSTREWVYQNAGYRCQCCGVPKQEAKYHKWLEAHETYDYDYAEGLATVNEIVALCHSCHNYIHSGRLQALLDAGKIPASKHRDIMQHGDRILREAGLTRPEPPEEIAEWSRWRIVICGRVYPTRWPSYEHWFNHYHRRCAIPEVKIDLKF